MVRTLTAVVWNLDEVRLRKVSVKRFLEHRLPAVSRRRVLEVRSEEDGELLALDVEDHRDAIVDAQPRVDLLARLRSLHRVGDVAARRIHGGDRRGERLDLGARAGVYALADLDTEEPGCQGREPSLLLRSAQDAEESWELVRRLLVGVELDEPIVSEGPRDGHPRRRALVEQPVYPLVVIPMEVCKHQDLHASEIDVERSEVPLCCRYPSSLDRIDDHPLVLAEVDDDRLADTASEERDLDLVAVRWRQDHR